MKLVKVILGGFAVSGRAASKTITTQFMNITPGNLLFGNKAGFNNDFETRILQINGALIFNSGSDFVTFPTAKDTNGYVLTANE